MPSAFFAYHDRAAAQRAADRITERGVEPGRVRVHTEHEKPNEKLVGEIDELVTGGFVGNFMSLWDRVFESNPSTQDSSAFSEAVRSGGAVVSVELPSRAECAVVDDVMSYEPPDQRTGWRDSPVA